MSLLCLRTVSTCRSRGCSDTACMVCALSRVWCRDTAPLCSLGIRQQNKNQFFALPQPAASPLCCATVLPSGPGSVGSVSKVGSGSQTQQRSMKHRRLEKSCVEGGRMRIQRVYLTSPERPQAQSGPAAGRTRGKALGSGFLVQRVTNI